MLIRVELLQSGVQTLVGHPRTPWSVKFHPTDPRYVASGCLGFQVRCGPTLCGLLDKRLVT